MEFKKYTSIVNDYKDREIQYQLMHAKGCHNVNELEFVITEKLHGANVQLVFYPDGKLDVGKRTSYLDHGASFYDIWTAIEDLNSEIETLKNHAKEIDIPFRLYGELFGGNVQQGINYGKKQKIMFFDMTIADQYTSQQQLHLLFDHMNLSNLLVPIFAKIVGLDSAMKFDINKNSLLTPEDYAKPNICEGIVIKPWNAVIEDTSEPGSSFMIKKKNDHFKERQRSKNKTPQQIPEHLIELHVAYSELINEPRVQSVVSKHGPLVSNKDIGKYIGLVIKDVMTDFLEDHREVFITLSKSDQKIVTRDNKIIGKLLFKIV